MQILEEPGRFYIPSLSGTDEDGAEITYSDVSSDIISIDHTYVDAKYRGQGVAELLFNKVLVKAKRDNKKIIPICSYAVKQFERKIELKAILADKR